MTQHIFVVHEHAEFVKDFQKAFSLNGTQIKALKSIKSLPKKYDSPNTVVVIASDENLTEELKLLRLMKKEGRAFFTIVSSSDTVERTFPLIGEMSERLHSRDTDGLHSAALVKKKEEEYKKPDPTLEELVEKKLSQFVAKIKQCKVKKLYGLLLREFEKPLIKLVLKETKGNQVRAAQLLGMNRNTLRKKVKELKIAVVKT
ncbi:MAG: helix-turn-helix domain-containing protein [Nitrospira sp.]